MSTKTSVEVTTETAVNWVNNELIRGFIAIAHEANADVGWLVGNRERLTEAISGWLETQALVALELEIRTQDETVLESYAFEVTYDGDQRYIEFPVEKVTANVSSYERDVYVFVNPVTNSQRRNDYGYQFSDADDRTIRSITSFGAGHIDVGVGQVVDYEANTNASPIGVFGVLVFAGLLYGVFFVGQIAIVGGVVELIPWRLPRGLTDFMEAMVLVFSGLIGIGLYSEHLKGSGFWTLCSVCSFLTVTLILLPLTYISPFGIVQLPLAASLITALLVLLIELAN